MNLPASVTDTPAYVQLLRMLWSFYAPLEARLDGVAGLSDALPDWPSRRKAHLLAADLASLGAAVPSGGGATTARLAELDGVAAAFGALYVVEGATLGGNIVGPGIRDALGAQDGAFTFYGCYGAQIGPRWVDFVAALGHEADARPEQSDAIVAAAILTFETFLAHHARERGPVRA